MTSKELKAAREKQERPKRRAAKKLHNAAYRLTISKDIPESTLTPSCRILRICELAARRGWMWPEEITKIAKLTGRETHNASIGKAV